MLQFLIGLGCGFGLGMLIAPAPGSETREQLMELARDPGAAVREKVSEIRRKAGDTGANLGRQAAESAVDKVMPKSVQGA